MGGSPGRMRSPAAVSPDFPRAAHSCWRVRFDCELFRWRIGTLIPPVHRLLTIERPVLFGHHIDTPGTPRADAESDTGCGRKCRFDDLTDHLEPPIRGRKEYNRAAIWFAPVEPCSHSFRTPPRHAP